MRRPPGTRFIEGRVLKISGADVFIDVGYKSDGVAPLAHFTDATGNFRYNPGDIVEVMVDSGHTSEGYVLLSHEKAARLQDLGHLEKALDEQLTISGRVLGRVKGGLSVDVGVRAFMPGSQVDVRPIRNVEQFVGQDIPVKIVKLNRKRGNVVVSRKLAVQEEVDARKSVTLENLQEGSVLTGTVKNLTEYGAFIDLGGIDGLLHVTDISYGRVTHPGGSTACGRRNYRPGAEVRSLERARFTGDEATGARSLGGRGRALSRSARGLWAA